MQKMWMCGEKMREELFDASVRFRKWCNKHNITAGGVKELGWILDLIRGDDERDSFCRGCFEFACWCEKHSLTEQDRNELDEILNTIRIEVEKEKRGRGRKKW